MATTPMVKTICISVVFAISSLFSHAQLRAGFTAVPVSGCAPLVVTFLDQSTGSPTQWRWDLGNGTISFLQNPSVTYFNPGQYNIKLVIQNASGSDSIVKNQYITINAQPTVNFSGSILTGCFPLPVQFTDLSLAGSGSIDSWQWDFGDGTSSTIRNPSHTYTASGNYNVSLRVRNSQGCYKTLTRAQYIQINSGVIANFTNSPPATCTAPVNINFQNLSTGIGILSYLWNFGDGGTSVLANPSHNYMLPGAYTVTLVVTNVFGCRDTLIKNNGIVIGTVLAGFNAPSTACINSPVAFVNTSSPVPVSVLWRFGDGTTSTSQNPVKSYSTPGSYQVKLISNFGACKDSVTRNITVLPKPVAAFSAPVTASCNVPFTVNFNNSSSGANSYQWLFGDGNSSAAASPAYTYTTPGVYTVTLITSNSSGCSDTLVKPAYISIQPPQVTINDHQGGCAPLSWTFIATINSIEPIVLYEWDFGDGTTSTEVSPNHTFARGVYDIKLKVTTASGCSITRIDTAAMSVGSKPVPDFIATPRNVCAKYRVNFSDLSTGTHDRWLWYFGDGGTSTDPNPNHIYEDTGFFSVKLVVWDFGCPDSIEFSNYIYIDPPVASFTTNLMCGNNLTLNFTDHSIGADIWEWDFGDGAISSLQNPSHTYADSGSYTVTLRVVNNRTGCDYTAVHDIAIYGINAGFTASDTIICKRSAVQFDATGFNPRIISYKWDFGDGSSDTSLSTSHTYNVSGIFDIRLIITDDRGCSDTLIKPRYIRVDGPVASFNASNPGSCSMSAINFTDNSTGDGIHPITKWVWDYGDGIIDTLLSGPFSHLYSNPGIYTVKLRVIDNNNCSDTSSRVNLVTISAPNAGFQSPDTVACPNRPIRFINTSTGLPGLTYTWHFGDGATSTVKDPIHLYAADGSYTILLVVRD
ncbi:MAG TPA: PKD domain-containing protein, partial [Ferruginibacter sp.]|nr:PKD domain-containing protein [Ferruginibacter sp.]